MLSVLHFSAIPYLQLFLWENNGGAQPVSVPALPLSLQGRGDTAQKGRRALRAPAHPVHHHAVSALSSCFIFLLLLRLSSPACLCSCVLSPEDSFLEHRFGGAVKVCIFNCCLGRISERRRCNEGNGTEEEERFTELTCTIPAPQTGMVKQKSAHEFELWLSRAKQEQSHGQVGLVVWERCAASTWQ